MTTVLLRCRDADMIGPVCDYVEETETFAELAREMRVHARTHNEADITDEDLSDLEKILLEIESGKVL